MALVEPPETRVTKRSPAPRSQDVAAGGSSVSPDMWRLVTDIPNDVSRALLSSWGVLANVLEFYGQRIGAEGSLDTACEGNSVRWLAEMGGLRARPAQSARTQLALSLDDTGKEPRVITLSGDGDIAVQNAPQAGEGAVVFESAQAITLNSRWNQMALQRPAAVSGRASGAPAPPKIAHGAMGMAFGTGTSEWRKGDGIMMSLKSESDGSTRQEFLIVSTIEKLALTNETLVSWAQPLALMEGSPPKPATANFTIEKVEHFGQPAALFGNSAAAWSTLSAKEQSAKGCVAGGLLQLNDKASGYWQNAASGLPRGDATCVFVLATGEVLLGTTKGLYRRAPEGEWEKARLPAGEHEITTVSDYEEVLTTKTIAPIPSPTPSQTTTVEDDEGLDGGFWGAIGGLFGGLTAGVVGGKIGQVVGDLIGGKSKKPAPSPSPPPSPPPTPAPKTTITSSKRAQTGLIYAGTKAGDVLISSDGGASWSKITTITHIPGTPINALIAALDETNDRRFLLAGTGQGLKVYDFVTEKWTSPKTGIGPSGAVYAMAYFNDTLVLASEYGAILITGVPGNGSSTPKHPSLDKPCKALAVSDDGKSLFIGTTAGVSTTTDLKAWHDFNSGFSHSEEAIHSLSISNQTIFAASKHGVWQSGISAANWKVFPDQVVPLFETPPSFANDANSIGQIGPRLSRSFVLAGLELPWNTSVTAIRPPHGALSAWTASNGRGRYLIVERTSKVVVGALVPTPYVNDLAVFQSSLLAASRESAALNKEWLDFTLAPGSVTLEKRAASFGPNTPVLIQGGGLESPLSLTVKTAMTTLHKAFAKSANATTLTFASGNEDLALASRRGAQAFASIGDVTPLGPAAPSAPLSGRHLTLKTIAPSLDPNRAVLLQGPRRALVIIEPIPSSVGALGPEFVEQSQVSPAQITAELDSAAIGKHAKAALKSMGIGEGVGIHVDVVAPSKSWVLRERTRKTDCAWQILVIQGQVFLAPLTLFECLALHQSGLPKRIRANQAKAKHFPTGSNFVWQDPADWQNDAKERAIIKSHKSQDLVLSHRLKTPFDADLCTLNANWVDAIAHQSVPVEILGTGGSSEIPQSTYTLAHGPLAYEIAGKGVRPLIDVYVDPPAAAFSTQDASLVKQGARWTPVHSIACASSQARVFEVEATGKGFTQLRFGDGDYGARLPGADTHIAASFKVGGGEHGNVPPGSLMALRRKPLGITRATNPFSAAGGRNAEGVEELRLRAQRERCTNGQIVTLQDYAGFAQKYQSVTLAKANVFNDPGISKPTIGLCVVWRDAPGRKEAKTRIKDIRDAMRQNRVDDFTLKIKTSPLVPVALEVEVVAAPTANPARLREAVTNALLNSFGKGAWPIGEDLPSSAVKNCTEQVPGVRRCEIVYFARPNKRGKANWDAVKVAPISFYASKGFDPGEIAGFEDKNAILVKVK